jgi:hypothetical protein
MAGEIKITGKKVIKTINKELQSKFPYLLLALMTPEEWEKSRKQGGKRKALLGNARLADVRTKTPKEASMFSIHGRTKVKNLEDNFVENFGLHVQLCYADKKDNFYYSGEDHDELSLTQLNREMEEKGMKKKPRFDSYK